MATATAAKSSSGSLRTYLITRLLLVIPMVWILVTLVFFVLRVVGDPIESALRRPAVTGRDCGSPPCRGPGSSTAVAVLGLPRRGLASRLRQITHRQHADQPHLAGQRSGDPRADVLGVAGGGRGRRSPRPGRGPLPRPVARRRPTAVRDPHLRDSGVLSRTAAQAAVRHRAALVLRIRPGQPRRRGLDQQRGPEHAYLHHQRDPVRQCQRRTRCLAAHRPAGGNPGVARGRHLPAAGAGQPAANPAGRLRRIGPRSRCTRALGHSPSTRSATR